MELSYDKGALQEYMDDIGGINEFFRRAKDESFNLYNSCAQRYTRLYTELEQANRKAYNKVEAAESMQRSADAEYDLAMRKLENAEDDSERESAQEQLYIAQTHQADAAQEMVSANVAYENSRKNLQKLSDLWEKYQPSINSAAHKVEDGLSAFNTLVSNGNRDLSEYMAIMDKSQAALYGDTTSSPEHKESIRSIGDNTTQGQNPSSFRSKKGNALSVVTAAGVASIAMSVAGKEYSFPNTKSGAAKAYRVAKNSGDQEMISKTNNIFKSFSSDNNGGLPNQQYVADTLSNLEANLPETFDKEMVLAGSQGRKLNTPATETSSGDAKGSWNGTVFVLDDSYIPEKYNDAGLSFGEIKSNLREQFGIEVGGIPYHNGVADFSSLSVAHVPTEDIISRSTGMSTAEYESLTQRERAEVFQRVFSDVNDGKSKREKNFDFADQIAAERKITIPGLPEGYTSSELKKWRSENKFSWDEQVNGGYNLVPTIVHGNVSHTGLVSTSGGAYTYLENRDADMKEHPEKYCWDEEKAPISISEVLGNKDD